MDGATFYARYRTMLHDKGLAYQTPTPEWGDELLIANAAKARDVVFAQLLDSGAILSVGNLVKQCVATDPSNAPDDFYRVIGGLNATNKWVLDEEIDLSLALAQAGFDTIYSVGGVIHGTADIAWYYARPQDDLTPTGGEFTEFCDGIMDAIMLLAVIETTMGETQDAADRLDDLKGLYLSMMETFE